MKTFVFAGCFSVGLTVGLLGFCLMSEAATIEVGNVNGQRAIVTFSKDFDPQQGKVYQIHEGGPAGASSRRLVVGGSLGFQSFTEELQLTSTTKNSISSTTWNLNASFGWNLGYFEFGPQFGYISTQEGGSSNSTSRMNFGAFADVNFVSNAPGKSFVPGIRLEPAITVFSNGASSASGFAGSGSIFGKWFFVDSAAFRPSVGYSFSQVGSGVGSLNVSGLLMTGAFQVYF